VAELADCEFLSFLMIKSVELVANSLTELLIP